MCGIAGYIGSNNIDIKRIKSTLSLMKLRGPDKQKYSFKKINNRNIYLLHSRLSIIDLNERSDQPYFMNDLVLIFNGEIYNYVELKKKIQNNVTFKTNSDTEVILHYYKLYGKKCFEYFEGMWSLAILDLKKKELILSRDRFGEKPLHIMQTKNGFFFGSEIKFIKKLAGIKKLEINYDKVREFLQFGYKSVYKKNDSFFKNISQIASSSIFVINKELKSQVKKYWKISKEKKNKEKYIKIIQKLKKILIRSIKLRLRSDVPIALCLSGGIDSSLIASIAKKKFKNNLETFSTFDSKDKRYDERKNISLLLKNLKLKKNFVDISGKLNFKKLTKQIDIYDSPVFTISDYLKNLLAEKIAKKNFKVVITGSGADEIFTGYYDHHLMYLYEIRKDKKLQNDYLSNWKKYVLPIIRNKYFKNPKLFIESPNYRKHVYDHNKELEKFFINPKKFNFKEKIFFNSLLKNRMMNETFFETIPIFTHSEDRTFMQYSIENRSPYLSKDLLEYMSSIPVKFMMKRGYTKNVLREISRNYLPNAIRLDRQKRGFNSSIKSLVNLKSKNFINFVNKSSTIYKIINKKNFLKSLHNNSNDNYMSKFIFSFISTKIFLDKNT
tara:strand:- start:228 stop:2057 length:1830 start_codon:yes stop_codon:yes gene_type:complete